MNAENFSKWMMFFIIYHKEKRNLDPTKKKLLILNSHKSHVSLEVLLNVKSMELIWLVSILRSLVACTLSKIKQIKIYESLERV